MGWMKVGAKRPLSSTPKTHQNPVTSKELATERSVMCAPSSYKYLSLVALPVGQVRETSLARLAVALAKRVDYAGLREVLLKFLIQIMVSQNAIPSKQYLSRWV